MESDMDTSIMYFGGSGGFFLLHMLMLSNKFFCEPLTDFQAVFEKQWDIKNPSNWKLSETRPNNASTAAAQTNLNKLFLHCNNGPGPGPGWHRHPGTKVLLYTDIHTQLALAEYKHAWCFHPSYVQARSHDTIRSRVIEQTTHINQQLLYAPLANLWNVANIQIKLQDLVTNGAAVLQQLGVQYTEQHAEFTDQWIKLHPANLQKLLTNVCDQQ